MLDVLDPFALKEKFDLFNFLRGEFGDLDQDLRFLKALRRALVPLPFVDRRATVDTDIFPPLTVRKHPLTGKRVGLVASGGSAAQVTLCGVQRAFEEAGIELAALSVCSGSAIWGSMMAAGLSAQEMLDASMQWTPSHLVDVDFKSLALLPLRLGRRFTGFIRGEAVERTLDRLYAGMTLAETKIPYYAIVLDIDTNELDYFSPRRHGSLSLARAARTAMALPMFVQPVVFDGHHFVDGGVVNVFPVDPLLDFEAPFDHIFGVNVILPPKFDGENIEGWVDKPLAILYASKQLYHVQWLALAKLQQKRAGERFTLLEPLPYQEIHGTRFFEVFLDNARWPEHVLTAYRHTKECLDAMR